MIVLLSLYVFGGVLLSILSMPLIMGKIKPHGWYGFRAPIYMNNPQVWYAVNRYSGKRLWLAGTSILAASLGLYYIPGISVDTFALACLAVFAVTFLVGLAQSIQYVRRITK